GDAGLSCHGAGGVRRRHGGSGDVERHELLPPCLERRRARRGAAAARRTDDVGLGRANDGRRGAALCSLACDGRGAPAMTRSSYFADLSYTRIQEILDGTRTPVLLFPVGSTEPHGPHSPLAT